ncbi:serine/threonine-protein phosphatase 7 long form [Salvia divinorum]|uniref:Serine/threonine-protein phosphatase 7 long form n=1 Tax=Salvia divinorum TaxID=28513 RepID=A0ABD1G8T5_SALDI
MTSPPVHENYIPYAVAWCGPSSHIRAPQHCTEHYKDQFSRMQVNQFFGGLMLCETCRPFVLRAYLFGRREHVLFVGMWLSHTCHSESCDSSRPPNSLSS